MLQSMRRHAKYFYVLFFVVIISFVFWGVGSQDKEQALNLADIGNERISKEEFWRAYEFQRENLRNTYKGLDFDEIEKKYDLKNRVLNSLIEDKVMQISASEIGLAVSDKELQESIRATPSFMRDGVFRNEIYVRVLSFYRWTPEYYEGLRRNEMLATKMRMLIVSGIDVNEADIAGIKIAAPKSEMVKQMALLGKRQAALKSYIDGAKAKMNIKVRMDLIS
jgi:peptidyl-prolyl cis-trans isomerase D